MNHVLLFEAGVINPQRDHREHRDLTQDEHYEVKRRTNFLLDDEKRASSQNGRNPKPPKPAKNPLMFRDTIAHRSSIQSQHVSGCPCPQWVESGH